MALALSAFAAAVEAKLVAAPSLGINVIDIALTSPDQGPNPKAHKGVTVHFPATDNEEDNARNWTYTIVDDEMEVTLLYKLKPGDQRVSRNTALVLEEAIRARLTDTTWANGLISIVYIGSTRGYHPDSREWYQIIQRFNTKREMNLS